MRSEAVRQLQRAERAELLALEEAEAQQTADRRAADTVAELQLRADIEARGDRCNKNHIRVWLHAHAAQPQPYARGGRPCLHIHVVGVAV